ncbi:MAG TPA: YihY family inner membrane protein [Burkholderiaceae bacterium]|nr:YihY family inner membrane protein [Burkholderiaceae bacterium]
MKLTTTIKSAVQEQLPDLVQTLQTWPWLDTLRTLRARFREDRLGLTASSLTFTTLISLVPLLTVMLAVFSAFPMFASFQDSLQKYFLQTLVPQDIASQVLKALTTFAAKAKGVGSVGLVLLVFAALALMLTIDRTLNGIWRVRTARPIAQRVLVYWAAATLGPLVLGVSLSLTSYALSASQGLVGGMPGGVSLLLEAIEFLLLVAAFAALFHYVPNTHVRWRHALGGAAFSAAGYELAKKLLGWYMQTVPTYTVIYGALAAVPIFLIWVYLAWVIVLLGAVVAAYAPSLQMRVKRWPDGPGARLQLALAVIRELARAHASGERGASGEQLAAALRTDPLQIEPILETLQQFDWVGRLDEPRDPRFVLLCDPARTPAQPLLAQLLLAPSPASHGLWQRAGFDTMTLQELLAA